jgi:hypothetical protein
MPEVIRERRAYVVLAVICIALCLGVFLLSVDTAKNNDRKFCEVLVIQTQYPVPQPVISGNPQEMKAWRVYNGRLKLAHDLGC